VKIARTGALLARTLRYYWLRVDRLLVIGGGSLVPSSARVVGDVYALSLFEAAHALIGDFQRYGPYVARFLRTSPQIRGGAVDWSKTISQKHPIIEPDGITYWDLLHRKSGTDPFHVLRRIQVTASRACSLLLGIPLDIDGSEVMAGEEFAAAVRHPTGALWRLGSSVFDDRGRRLLGILGQLVGRWQAVKYGAGSDALFAEIEDFAYVWEAMVARVLGGPKEAQPPITAGSWYQAASGISHEGLTPRVDSYRTGQLGGAGSEAYLVLFDAKYKTVGSGREPSGSANDHYKQGYYWRLVARPAVGRGLNALVFPRVDGAFDSNDALKYLGSHTWPLGEPPVSELSLDYEAAARSYVGDVPLPAESLVRSLVSAAGFKIA
jgi:hypothetical protein